MQYDEKFIKIKTQTQPSRNTKLRSSLVEGVFTMERLYYKAKRTIFAKYFELYFNNPSSVANEVQEENKG